MLTALKMSIFGIILVPMFPHSDQNNFQYGHFSHSGFYVYIYLALGFVGRDGGLSTLCHSCGFACQQRRVLKTFPGPCYL